MAQIDQENTFIKAFALPKPSIKGNFNLKYGENVKFTISNAQPSLLVMATVKTRHVLKRSLQGRLTEGYTNTKKNPWFMVKNLCFEIKTKKHDFFIMIP